MTKRRAPAPPPAPTHLIRHTSWSGIHAGELVDVHDPRARGSTWRFEAHVENVKTGEEWVEVVGGRRGESRRRSFRVESVFPPADRRGRTGAALVDAPRLPL